MLGSSFALVCLLLLLDAISGAALGILVSGVIRLSFRSLPWKLTQDAAVGAVGFLIGSVGAAIVVPWPSNALTYSVGSTVVVSTMNRYQHPNRIASALAVALVIVMAARRHFIVRR